MIKKKIIITVLTFLGLYLASTGISFALFSYVVNPANLIGGDSQEVDTTTETTSENNGEMTPLLTLSGEKTEICPLNGEKFTVTEKDAWQARRPLTVMIENHEDSRPQSGLSSADIVYETVAEGGITRFMGVYYCDAQSHEATVGPVRSVRTYFLDWASEYGDNPLFAHVGGANCNHGCPWGRTQADALGQIDKYGWGGITGNDLSQFSIGYPTFWRDYERLGRTVATEHTMYSTTERLWAVGKTRGWTNVDEQGNAWDTDFIPWKYTEGDIEAGQVATLSYNFWEDSPAGDYSVSWQYDPNTKMYLRNVAAVPHMDRNTNSQLAFKNIVVIFQTETSANDGYDGHLLYGTIGSGTGVLFQDGNATEITWKKPSRLARTIFSAGGKEISFVPGKIWISVVPSYSEATLKY